MSEKDPYGKDAHEGGAKLDAGKNRLSLVLGGFSLALQEVGKVGTYGANKYSPNGWKTVPNGLERYADAMLRHIFKGMSGEKLDPDTNLTHAAHAAWNALAVLELLTRESEMLEACRPGKVVAISEEELNAMINMTNQSVSASGLFQRQHIQD